jgi:hypothetical protein
MLSEESQVIVVVSPSVKVSPPDGEVTFTKPSIAAASVKLAKKCQNRELH